MEKSIRILADQMLNERYASLLCPEIVPLIDPIFTGYKQLLALPTEQKHLWQKHHISLSKKADHGLVFPKGGTFDQKWTFMFRRNLAYDLLMEQSETEAIQAHRSLQPDELEPWLKWFSCMDMIQYHLYNTIAEVAHEMDTQMPGYSFYDEMTRPELVDRHVLRLLQYLYHPSVSLNKGLADGHLDQGYITAQGYESIPGLVLVPNYQKYPDNPEKWDRIDYEYIPGKVMIMTGKKFADVTGGKIPPMWHYVDAREPVDRTALILFSHTAHESVEMR